MPYFIIIIIIIINYKDKNPRLTWSHSLPWNSPPFMLLEALNLILGQLNAKQELALELTLSKRCLW
jgi:hypothetical protein